MADQNQSQGSPNVNPPLLGDNRDDPKRGAPAEGPSQEHGDHQPEVVHIETPEEGLGATSNAPDDADEAHPQPGPSKEKNQDRASTKNGTDPSNKNKPKRDSNARLREQLLKERHQQKVERERQNQARLKRKAERQARVEQARANQEKRRQQAEDIQKQRRDYESLAEARVQFERTQQLHAEEEVVTSPSEESDEGYEDLPGEVCFLEYFKKEREHSPDRLELMGQEIGPDRDSINRVNEELLFAENMLGEGVLPVGEDMEELLESYQNFMQRITFMCHTQGKYAQLRGLKRAKILLELDQDLKQRAEGLLQLVGKLRHLKRQKNAERRQVRRGRLNSLPGQTANACRTQEGDPPPIRSRRAISSSGRPTHNQVRANGPGTDQLNDQLTPPNSARSQDSGNGTAIPGTGPRESGHGPPERGAFFGTFHPGNPSYYSGNTFGRGQGANLSSPGPTPGSRNGPTPTGPPRGGIPSGGNYNGTAAAPPPGNSYTPYYLRPNGEGALFYTTLPAPWNITPEHVPTPLTQVPTMLKAGCFTEFSGVIQAYRTFRASFITGCHMLDLPVTTKYMVLKSCLDKNSVLSDLLNTTEPSAQGYRAVIVTLEERFGHGGALLNYHLQRLNDLPRVRETSLEDMDLLVDTARGYEAARAANGAQNAQDPTYFNLVKSKLPDRLRREYARHCRENGISPMTCDVNLLISWVKIYVAEPLRLEPPTRRTEERPSNKRNHHANGGAHGNGATFNTGKPRSGSGFQPGPLNTEKSYNFYTAQGCALCKMGHTVAECPEFLALTVSKRFDILRDLNLCFKCLQSSHVAATCNSRITCHKCKGDHHVLLHCKRKTTNAQTGTNINNNANLTHVSNERSVRFAAPATDIDPRIIQNDYVHSQEDFITHARQQAENKEYSNYLFVCRGLSPVSLFFQWVNSYQPQNWDLSSKYNVLMDLGAQFTAVSKCCQARTTPGRGSSFGSLWRA